MTDTGRNDPCPCGSGRKYKKCCLQALAAAGSKHDREAGLQAIERFATGPGWRELQDAAIIEFWDGLEPGAALGSDRHLEAMSAQTFEWWFYFDYEYEPGRRVVDAFLEATPSLAPGARDYLARARDSLFRVYEVIEVRPGVGMTLRDVLSGRETRVLERSGSKSLHRWNVIATRILPVPGSSEPVLDGGVLPLGPERARSLTEWLSTELASGDYESEEDLFRDVVPDIHRAWIAPAETPSLVNFDGDALVFVTVHFDVGDAAALVTALDGAKGLERVSTEGEPPKWTWAGKGKDRKEPVVFGWLSLKGARLELRTNSVERAGRGRKLVEKLAGAAVTYRLSVNQEPEQAMAALGELEPSGPRAQPSGLPAELQEPAHTAVEQHLIQHYERWIEEPVPLLAGMSPRAAARDSARRKELVTMLKELEGMYEKALSSGEAAFDPSWMWEELGLDGDRDAPGSRKQAPILGHESLGEHFPELLEIGRDVARRLRAVAAPSDRTRVAGSEDFEHDLAFQRLVRQGGGRELAQHAAALVSNFELFLRKVFWVSEPLSWMLGATRLDVTGDAVRLPFASTAFVFTDRYALGLAERMDSRLPDGLRVGRMLQVLTVYATEHRDDDRGDQRVLDLTFMGDVLDGTRPSIVPCRLELRPEERIDEALRRLAPRGTGLDEDEVVHPLYDSTPLRDLVALVVNAVLYATSPDAERQELEPAAKRPNSPGSSKDVPIFTSETVFYLPGTIDIKTLDHVKRARRGGREREQSRRCMVRGHWRRAHERWEDQRPRWIRPHWRGPSAAAIIERQYRLEP